MPKDNKNNRSYTKEQRDSMISRMLPPNNYAVSALSTETGIPKNTLSNWKEKAMQRTNINRVSSISRSTMTSKDKFLVVMETYAMSEIELSEYCRKSGFYADEVKKWRSSCMSSIDKEPYVAKEMKEELLNEKKKVKDLEREIARKDKALAETAALLVLQKKVRSGLGGKRGRLTPLSDRKIVVGLISEARRNGARLKQACKVVGITDRTFERWVYGGKIKEDQRPFADRPEPSNKLTREEYLSVVRIANLPEYVDLPPSQIVPDLADKGIYIASESTMYRILRNENMQHHRGRSRAPGEFKLPDTHIATAPNQVWTWDITYLNTDIRGIYFKLYMIVDIFSRKIVGWEVWEEESGELASELVERTVFVEKARGKTLVLHSDNGSAMKAWTLKAKLEMLGVMTSYSRPRVSNDNPYSEALFRTCKYRSDYPSEGFKSLEDARRWVKEFVDWYNNKHYHSGLNFITPCARHTGQAERIMAKREKVYKAARKLHPERWSRQTRNWDLPEYVALNPTAEREKVS